MKTKQHSKKTIFSLTGLMLLFANTAGAADNNYLFFETFDTQEDFNSWTTVDLNGGRTWEFLDGAAAYMLDYQTGLPGDDWYISPAISLNSEYVYELAFDLGIQSMPECLKVALGTSADVESFTTVIADFPNATSDINGTKKYKIIVPKTADYHIGFYAYSEPEKHRIDIDNVSIKLISSTNVPASVSNLTATAGEKGAMNATLTLKAPSLNAGNQPLEELTAIRIYKNNEETPVFTFDNPTTGAELTWTDDTPVTGFNNYRVVAENTTGVSTEESVTVFVGHDVPVAVNELTAQINKDLSVTLNWQAPTASANGGYVDLATVKYRILRNGTIIEEAFEETSYTDNIPTEPTQRLTTYSVIAYTEGGDSETAESNEILTGTPLEIPYKESFANAQATVSPWFQDHFTHDFDWKISGDDEAEEVSCQDNDGGMLVSDNSYGYTGNKSRFISPMFNLSSSTNPILTFWFFHAQSPWYDPEWDGVINDHLEVQISVDGGEWRTLENAIFYNAHDNNGWVKCEVNLPKNEGSFINIGLLAVTENDYSSYKNIYVDNITIDEAAQQYDLAINSFNSNSKRCNIGDELTFTVEVFNKGAETTNDYTVRLYKNDKMIEEESGEDIQPAQTIQKEFTYTATLDDAQEEFAEWHAEIDYAADQFLSNNQTDTIRCSVRKPELPTVSNLQAEKEGNGILLTWDAAKSIPATPHGYPVRVTDDVEGYESFIIENIGDWTTVDLDQSTTLISPRIPNSYPNQGEQMAFQVFNAVTAGCITEETIDYALAPHSGEQYFICPSADYPAENDDWLISPRLDGRAQTISFFAKAASYESEWMEVYYSTTDTHTDSFIKINEGDHVYVPDGWTEFSYNLPDGVRYFAIRCVRRTVFLLIDDLTYNQYEGATDAITLEGYNVYQNGNKLNENLLTENKFNVSVPSEGTYSFRVTAVYKEGESDYSEEVSFDYSGINDVSADKAIVTIDGNIVRITTEQPTDITIYSLDGKQVFQSLNSKNETVVLDNGMYVVKTGNSVTKIIL